MKALQKNLTLGFYQIYIKEPGYDSNEELLQQAKDKAKKSIRNQFREHVKNILRDLIITKVVKYRTYKKINK